MSKFFKKCPPAFPPDFPPQRPAFGSAFAVTTDQPIPSPVAPLTSTTTTLLLPVPGPLNNVVSTGAGLTLQEPGVYALDYSVSILLEAAVLAAISVGMDFTGQLRATNAFGSFIIGGSQSRVADTLALAAAGALEWADVLTSPSLLEITVPTTISIEVINSTTSTTPFVTGGFEADFASLRATQIA
ncbi:hypothetical protein [Bacillus bingmayongensis]|uniref:hypothetical protein n=1 Tax=Bacillus bingmayongensis TaxID=1150157 RepID=UPI000366F9FB|nr:hypothetical protein [Bacillus bingmayongensis]MBY0600219.1 hypothetical protein [Bacillus bingmayongensis]